MFLTLLSLVARFRAGKCHLHYSLPQINHSLSLHKSTTYHNINDTRANDNNLCLLQIFPSLLWLCGIGGSFLSCALVCGGAVGE